jgi:hypothetical protein
MLIGFIIWSVVALLFLGIGVSSWKSKEAVGFFTFAKPSIVSDISRYNHSVAILWIVFAIIFEILGIPVLFIEQNSPVFMVVILGVVALLIGTIIAYIRIETKYKA